MNNTTLSFPETTLREVLGYTEEEVMVFLIVLKDDINWMKKNRPILLADILAYTGIHEDEILEAKHRRFNQYLVREVYAPLTNSDRLRPIQLILNTAARSGPSEAEQKETMARIIEQVNQKFILPKAGEKTL